MESVDADGGGQWTDVCRGRSVAAGVDASVQPRVFVSVCCCAGAATGAAPAGAAANSGVSSVGSIAGVRPG